MTTATLMYHHLSSSAFEGVVDQMAMHSASTFYSLDAGTTPYCCTNAPYSISSYEPLYGATATAIPTTAPASATSAAAAAASATVAAGIGIDDAGIVQCNGLSLAQPQTAYNSPGICGSSSCESLNGVPTSATMTTTTFYDLDALYNNNSNNQIGKQINNNNDNNNSNDTLSLTIPDDEEYQPMDQLRRESLSSASSAESSCSYSSIEQSPSLGSSQMLRLHQQQQQQQQQQPQSQPQPILQVVSMPSYSSSDAFMVQGRPECPIVTATTEIRTTAATTTTTTTTTMTSSDNVHCQQGSSSGSSRCITTCGYASGASSSTSDGQSLSTCRQKRQSKKERELELERQEAELVQRIDEKRRIKLRLERQVALLEQRVYSAFGVRQHTPQPALAAASPDGGPRLPSQQLPPATCPLWGPLLR